MDASRARIDSDAPTEVDELGRQQLVDVLARITSTAETPLVIAIYGAWGSGKTSLLKQLRRRLDPEHDGRSHGEQLARTVWFDPWMFQFDDTPALGLLHAAVAQLGLRDRKIVRNALAGLAVAFGEDIQIPFIGVRVGSLLRVRSEIAKDDFNRREQREQMRQHFRSVLEAAGANEDERVVFLIDDLDRCKPRNAMALLEALKLYMDMPGCIYVLGVDRQPLEAAVASEYSELGVQTESFLDKIIQLPFTLPTIDPATLITFIEQRLPDDLQDLVPIFAAAAADEPRNVKRMTNALLVTHELAREALHSESYNPTVLATIVLIQNESPDLYRQIRIDHALLTDLFLSRDSVDVENGGDEVLWAKYINTDSRLDRALQGVSIPPDIDLTPYLTLAAVVPPARPHARPETERRAVYLSFRNGDRAWARRIARSLEDADWHVLRDEADLVTGQPNRDAISRDLAESVAVLVLVGTGWLERASGLEEVNDRVRLEIELALEQRVPMIPVRAGVKSLPSDLPDPVRRLEELQSVSIDESRYERSIVEIDRFLSEVAQIARDQSRTTSEHSD